MELGDVVLRQRRTRASKWRDDRLLNPLRSLPIGVRGPCRGELVDNSRDMEGALLHRY